MERKHIYFVSDAHFGLPSDIDTITREKLFVDWLNSIKDKANRIILLGDIFDFWFEYKKVVPKGFTRVLGTLAKICDEGIPVDFYIGNHDMWTFGYLAEETGMNVIYEPQIKKYYGKTFYIAHGDGLGPYDKGYKRLKAIFTNKFARFLFRWLHPDIGVWLAHTWSHKSRYNEGEDHIKFLGPDKEWLVLYAKEFLKERHIDYFIFGHRHITENIKLSDTSTLFYTGDWLKSFSYLDFDGDTVKLKFLEK